MDDRLREGPQGRRLAGREEGARRAPLTEHDEVRELWRVVGVQPLAGNEATLDGREDRATLPVGQGWKRLGVGHLDRVGRCLPQQEAVLPDHRVLVGRRCVDPGACGRC